MRIIVHFGMPKTGTTALQSALSMSRDRLRDHNILYPRFSRRVIAHHPLNVLFRDRDNLPGYLRHASSHNPEAFKSRVGKRWAAIRRDIDRLRPRIVILSSELFFVSASWEDLNRLHSIISEISDDILPCIYIREPAAQYLSALQQTTKCGIVRPPYPLTVRHTIEHIEDIFATRPSIRQYEKGRLLDDDIVRDFFSVYLKDHMAPDTIQKVRVNVTMSAESMSILSRYRAVNYHDHKGISNTDSQRFMNAIAEYEKKHERFNKPRLRAGLAEEINNSSVDLLWLRERYGISFSTIDYEKIDRRSLKIHHTKTKIEDIIEIDNEWQERIIFSLLSMRNSQSKKYWFRFQRN